ncbi:hypothetical protein [Streptomyces adonidis]|uniref:hypothetical protein n=1 Tax=Streptomyces adonidis TaxID=3231367 RepID=UPI0034DB4862
MTNAQVVSGPTPKATTRQIQGDTPIPIPAKATMGNVAEENTIRTQRVRRSLIVSSTSARPRGGSGGRAGAAGPRKTL